MKAEEFKDPPVDYRPVPFLSANDDLEEERLRHLVKEYVDKGWGGLFFHARVGLITPYMGNRWFNLVRSCVAECQSAGGRFWIYDENGWPSGQGGGQVQALGPAYRSKILFCSKSRRHAPAPGTIRTELIVTGRRRARYDFIVKVMPAGYLPDLLSPEVVKAFIESTHELYKLHVGRHFGRTVQGVFTDEPQYATYHTLRSEQALPWTDRLPEEFQRDHGYPILDNVASLFFDVGPFRKVRFDYFSTVTRLFVEAYSKQIYQWCRENGLKYTGHYEWEDSFLGQICCIGSAMQHYEYMHFPGIDHLGRGLHNPWVEKQVASVASQLGKARVLSESYGVSGQSLNFHDRRWVGNWQYALGINFLNHHVSLYSLRGVRKRDYPPTLSIHQPWWEHNRVVADHFSRLSYVMSQGRRSVDVLVISSINSAWCEYKPSDPKGVEEVFEGFKTLTGNLLSRQIDFEYGEEFILAGHGRVEGRRIRVGRSTYRLVILPPMKSLKATTFSLLRDFASGGGTILCVGEKPSMIEGEESSDLGCFMSRLPVAANEADPISSFVRARVPQGLATSWVSGPPMDRLLIHRRRLGRADLYFMVNTDYRDPIRLEVRFAPGKSVCELVTLTGSVMSCPNALTLDLAAGEGRIFVQGSRIVPEGSAEGGLSEPSAKVPVKSRWRIRREAPNQCVLDYARWRTPGTNWSGRLPVWRVHDEVKALGQGKEFEVAYEFKTVVCGPLDLVVEDAQRYDIYANGKRVQSNVESWWLDPGLKQMPIGAYVQSGRNIITLRGRWDGDLAIEDVYLLGDFGVRVGPAGSVRLEDEVTEVEDIADLRLSGYPFYAGALRLETQLDLVPIEGRPFIEFDDLGGVVAEFSINGRDVGKVFWREYRLPVEEAIVPGRNTIAIRLINSLRNLLGPRHWRADEFTGVNPDSFRDHHGWTDSYVGTPLGMKGLRLAWR